MEIIGTGLIGFFAGMIMRDCKTRFGDEVFYIMLTVLAVLFLLGLKYL